MKATYKQVTKASYIRAVSALAQEIWAECYRRVLPGKQLKLALEQYQSPDAISDAMDEGVNYFLVQMGSRDVGYFAFHVTAGTVVIDHIYLKKEFRTRGLGREILTYCEKLASGENLSIVNLYVPQKCQETVTYFKHRGYRPAEDVLLPVQGGESLLCWRMEKAARF